jgi:hypothetical protein
MIKPRKLEIKTTSRTIISTSMFILIFSHRLVTLIDYYVFGAQS